MSMRMAEWCIHVGFDDQVYLRLTRLDRDAFVVAKNKQLKSN